MSYFFCTISRSGLQGNKIAWNFGLQIRHARSSLEGSWEQWLVPTQLPRPDPYPALIFGCRFIFLVFYMYICSCLRSKQTLVHQLGPRRSRLTAQILGLCAPVILEKADILFQSRYREPIQAHGLGDLSNRSGEQL